MHQGRTRAQMKRARLKDRCVRLCSIWLKESKLQRNKHLVYLASESIPAVAITLLSTALVVAAESRWRPANIFPLHLTRPLWHQKPFRHSNSLSGSPGENQTCSSCWFKCLFRIFFLFLYNYIAAENCMYRTGIFPIIRPCLPHNGRLKNAFSIVAFLCDLNISAVWTSVIICKKMICSFLLPRLPGCPT